MAWKIDSSKAYDGLQWHFITGVLSGIVICGCLFCLIMHNITYVQYQKIVNDELKIHTMMWWIKYTNV